jgi:hypothetical protein
MTHFVKSRRSLPFGTAFVGNGEDAGLVSLATFISELPAVFEATTLSTAFGDCGIRGFKIPAFARTILFYDSRRHTHSGCVVRDIGQDDGICSDPRVVANADFAQHLCSGSDSDIVADNRRRVFIPTNSDCYVLVDSHVLTDDTPVIEACSHSVMSEMNVIPANPGLVRNEAAKHDTQELLQQKRKKRYLPAVERVCGSVDIVWKI